MAERLWKRTFVERKKQISTAPTNRIAVIGSGMAGLSAAWMLKQEGYCVTVFEKGHRPGLAAHSRDFASFFPEAREPLVGDVPSRMFNSSLWPELTALYQKAGIATEPVDHRQTFHRGEEIDWKIGLPYAATLLRGIANPRSRRLMTALKKFQSQSLAALQQESIDSQTFGEFIDTIRTQEGIAELLDRFLFPALTSTVFTCPTKQLLNFPCRTVLNALEKITSVDSPLMRATCGAIGVSRALLAGVEDIRFDTTVEGVTQSEGSVFVDAAGERHEFHRVVIATQANHASRLIEADNPEEASLLRQFRYVDVPVTAHTDSAIMPPRKSDWSTFNFSTRADREAMCTVWMNRFHNRWAAASDVFHSIFPCDRIDADSVLFSAVMQRPVLDSCSEQLQQKLDAIHTREGRVCFAGSYASRGVPLLESAVQSSRRIVDLLKRSVPGARV